MAGFQAPNVRIDLFREEDWNDPFTLEIGGVAVDLGGKLLELYVRPHFDFAPAIMVLSSLFSQGIVITNAALGEAVFRVDQPQVEPIPTGTWDQFLRLIDGANVETVWRGELVMHPGRANAL